MDFVQAAEAGSRLSLERRGQDISAGEAQGRLGLGYAELGASEQENQAKLQAERDAAARDSQQQQFENRLKTAQVQQGINESDRDYSARLQELGINQARLDYEKSKAAQPRVVRGANGSVFSFDPTAGTLDELNPPTMKDSTIKISIGKDTNGRDITQNVPVSRLKDVLQSLPSGWSESPYNKAALATIPKGEWDSSGETNKLPDYLQLNQPTIIPDRLNVASPVGTNGFVRNNSPASKESVGGYQIGKKYSGLTYLGGDPNDESNWQK